MRKWGYVLGSIWLLVACSGGETSLNGDVQGADLLDAEGDVQADGVADVADVQMPDQSADEQSDTAGGDGSADGEVGTGDEGWVRLSLEAGKRLRAVWSDGSVWVAVGDAGQIFWQIQGEWVPAASPTTRDLYAVYGESLDDLYAVGDAGTVIRFQDGTWVLDETQVSGLENIVLRGVWGESGHVYAVGDLGTILHKTGDAWEAEQSLVTYTLYAVWGESLLDVYAAGGGGSLLRRSGEAWTSYPLTSGSVSFHAVTGTSGGAMVAAGTKGAIVRQDAGGFVQEMSNDTQNRDLHGAWMYSSGNVWLIGDNGALIHREGEKWMLSEIAGPNNRNETFHGLWGTKEGQEPDALAVGERGVAVRFDGDQWNDELVGVRADLMDLDGLSDTDALAVGSAGVLLAWDGYRWFGLQSATDQDLEGVATFGGGYVAVGAAGTLVRVKDQQAATIPAGITENLHGACSNGDTLVVVGEEGSVYRTNDLAEWHKVETNRFDLLRDCSIDNAGAVIAVGDSGSVLRILNEYVSPVAVATAANLRRISRSGATLTIVGDNGVVLRGAATSYTAVGSNPGSFFYGVTATPDGFVAVGWGGEVLEWSEEGSKRYFIDDAGVLLQIWADPQGNLLSVGREGRAYRKTL